MCSVSLVPNEPDLLTGMTLIWRCYSDEELEQVKNLCEMLSVNCSENEQKFRTDVVNTSCEARTLEQGLWDSDKARERENNTKQESSSSSSNCTINAPFHEPSTLLSNLSVSNPRHFVLASRRCVILVVLPSLAYVYYKKSKQWKSIVFSEAVIRCCLVQGKYFTLSREL